MLLYPSILHHRYNYYNKANQFLLIPDITLKLYFEFRNFLGAVVIVVVSTDSCYNCLSDYEPLIF